MRDITADISYLVFTLSNIAIENFTLPNTSSTSIYSATLTANEITLGSINASLSNLNLSSATVEDMYLYDTVCWIKESKVSSNPILLHDKVSLHVDSSEIYGISMASYDPKSMSILVQVNDTNISNLWAMYYTIQSYKGVLFDIAQISGEYDTKTTYTNIQINSSSQKENFFEVIGHGRLKIHNYSGEQGINMLIVNTSVDTTPPTITPLNGTKISFELGLSANISFKLTDETPTTYTLHLNDSLIQEDTYNSGDIITITISKHINKAGTYVLTLDAYDIDNNKGTIKITILTLPSEPPRIIMSPQDEISMYKGESKALKWKATDASPSVYKIYLNGDLITSKKWTNNTIISITFNATNTGQFNITIIFYDILNQKTSDTTIINVSEKPTTTTTTPEKPTKTKYIILVIIIITIATVLIITLKKKQRKNNTPKS